MESERDSTLPTGQHNQQDGYNADNTNVSYIVTGNPSYREDQKTRKLPCDVNPGGKGALVLLGNVASTPVVLDTWEVYPGLQSETKGTGVPDEPLVFDYRPACLNLQVHEYWHLVERDLELNRTVLLQIKPDVLNMLQEKHRADKVFSVDRPQDKLGIAELFLSMGGEPGDHDFIEIYRLVLNALDREKELLSEYGYEYTTLEAGTFLDWVEEHNGIKENEGRRYIDGAVFR